MTQPPDEPRPPDERPADPLDPAVPPPDSSPTVFWSQPPETPPPYGSATPPPSPPASTGWELPNVPPPMPDPARTDGWQVPGGPQPVMLREGYVVGSTGSRFVAWLIDSLLVAIVPGALAIYVVDWNDLFRQMSAQIQVDANGRLIPNYGATYALHMTIDVMLVYLILVGVQFLYFVGFWTSRWQATPGMIGLKLKVVDQTTGAGLTMVQASKRWIAMGYPLGLAPLVPVLAYAAGLAQLAVNGFLFLSTVTDRRRQGLHDKFAGSQVIRHISSGSGATALGCFVYGIMLFALWIAAVVAFFAVAGPTFFEYFRTLPRYTS